jgi:hypothetical protein
LTTDAPNDKSLCSRGETFRDIPSSFEAAVGFSEQAPGDEGFADFVNWRWLAQFRVLSLGSGLKVYEAKIEVEQSSPGAVVLPL